MDAQYIIVSHQATVTIWLRLLVEDIGLVQLEGIILKSYNQKCFAIAKNPKQHARTNYIDVQHHFRREKVEMGGIDMIYYKTKDMWADLLTKALISVRYNMLSKALGLTTK